MLILYEFFLRVEILIYFYLFTSLFALISFSSICISISNIRTLYNNLTIFTILFSFNRMVGIFCCFIIFASLTGIVGIFFCYNFAIKSNQRRLQILFNFRVENIFACKIGVFFNLICIFDSKLKL